MSRPRPAPILDGTVIDFDEQFWEWWMQDRPNPFDGAAATRWGSEALPEATAAIRYNRWSDDRWTLDGYLAMLRSGGLEFGLGRSGSARWRWAPEQDEMRVFFLTTIVGRIWVALDLYAEVLDRFPIEALGSWPSGYGTRSGRYSATSPRAGPSPRQHFPASRCRDAPIRTC